MNLAGRCREHGINVSLVPQPYELYLSKPTFVDLEGLPVLQLRGPLISTPVAYSKRILDAVVSVLLAVTTAPIVLAAALMLRRAKGRAFQRHRRCGQHGKMFDMFRLNIDRGVSGAPLLERVLERLSITELPQLWNVILGDMSLVGPRPESPERVKRYSEWQQERLSVKPGMTGLAQVHGLREQNSSEEKTRFDLQYRLNPSLLADISLLLQTVWTLVFRVVRYSRLVQPQTPEAHVAPESRIVEEIIIEQSTSFSMEEVLASAHRSESSAD
jgi:lipopolysaccharide/colanic/teichoic acid biosynthesis glycosyltransferase